MLQICSIDTCKWSFDRQSRQTVQSRDLKRYILQQVTYFVQTLWLPEHRLLLWFYYLSTDWNILFQKLRAIHATTAKILSATTDFLRENVNNLR